MVVDRWQGGIQRTARRGALTPPSLGVQAYPYDDRGASGGPQPLGADSAVGAGTALLCRRQALERRGMLPATHWRCGITSLAKRSKDAITLVWGKPPKLTSKITYVNP